MFYGTIKKKNQALKSLVRMMLKREDQGGAMSTVCRHSFGMKMVHTSSHVVVVTTHNRYEQQAVKKAFISCCVLRSSNHVCSRWLRPALCGIGTARLVRERRRYCRVMSPAWSLRLLTGGQAYRWTGGQADILRAKIFTDGVCPFCPHFYV